MIKFTPAPHMQRIKKMRINDEEALIEVIAEKYGMRYVDLSMVSIDTDALKLVPEARAREAGIAAFKLTGRKVFLAMRSPLPALVKEEIRRLEEKRYQVVSFLASKRSIEKAWSRYGDISYAIKTKKGVIDLSSADIQDVLNQVTSLEIARDFLRQAVDSNQSYRISKIIELILYSAFALKASDVHIETSEIDARIRFRLDGMLTEIVRMDLATYNRILSRIKLTAGLKLSIKNNAQDGRFTIKMADMDIEIRTSTLPDVYGESIVLRLLDPSAISVPLEELGMLPYLLEIVKDQIMKPNGMIINTGPTGQGKSTTLFSLLKKKISPQIKIITVEDPIEYHVGGITQTQVDREKGYTFLSGLRSALRQDPDVIMIGEIRDKETAKTAVNSALTGHLVLSTLHTNSAAGTFPRFVDLGVDSKILATAINIALAQRLVRKLCVHCKKEIDLSLPEKQKIKAKIDGIFNTIENKSKYIDERDEYHIYEAVGCEKCNNTGYKGRIAVLEAILMDEKLEVLLKSNPTEREIIDGTRHQGILTMKQDGVIKILNGTTSFEELRRVVEL